MRSLRIWIVLSWIAVPTVMYGGYSLVRLIHQGDRLTAFQTTRFRAGHAHAGVLLLMSLLYVQFLEQTLGSAAKQAGCIAMFVGILAQSPNEPSIGQRRLADAARLANATKAQLLLRSARRSHD